MALVVFFFFWRCGWERMYITPESSSFPSGEGGFIFGHFAGCNFIFSCITAYLRTGHQDSV